MSLDCIVIGYNEPPFTAYESLLRQYGTGSEAYRDLRFSFVDVEAGPKTYIELLNYVRERAADPGTPVEPYYSGAIPNLAAAYLTAFVRRHGFTADYINLYQNEKEKLAAMLAERPLCVAITTTFYVINVPVTEMVQFIRACNPDVPVIVGGPLIANHARRFATAAPPALAGSLPSAAAAPVRIGADFESALADLDADVYVIEGQGEATLVRLIERLRSGASFADVPNIVYREQGAHWQTAKEPEQNDIDASRIDWERLSDQPLGCTIQMRTARSCAFSCAFCNYPERAGKLTLSHLDSVRNELDSIRRRGNVRNVVFIDDTFNVPLARFKDLCRMMIAERYGFEWYSYFRCSNSDQEAFDLMAESGCKGVFLGIESGSPTILKNMSKAATVEKYEEGIRQLKARGVTTFGSFILGFPGETDATVAETVDFIKRTKPDFYRVQCWYCEAGTPIDRQRAKYGINGDGFVWEHATMDSLTAMDHIERIFLTIHDSAWLPQWSFDFWIIPYLRGEGMTPEMFRQFVGSANRLLATQVASMPARERELRRTQYVDEMVQLIRQPAMMPS
jgi:radical SAM PhpK family P-methyltransferase